MSSKKVYITLTLINTLSNSLIWGINTLFLLDAGLSNFEAFLANAFFTLGMVVFEIPTGIVADSFSRRLSFLLGTVTLIIFTLIYFIMWQFKLSIIFWCIASIGLGLGFTFFSGAIEAWLVDALKFEDNKEDLENIFSQGQIAAGISMLFGSILGAFLAQLTNLGFPYILRSCLLLVSFLFAFMKMKDLGHEKKDFSNIRNALRDIFKESIQTSFKNEKLIWIILLSPIVSGVSIYTFYAAAPYLVELYKVDSSYFVSGIGAALIASTQIISGLIVPKIKVFFKHRTSLMLISQTLSVVALIFIGMDHSFIFTLGLFFIWGLFNSILLPIRSAYINSEIESSSRATVLSFDGLLGSTGSVVTQPVLGKSADIYNYASSFIFAGIIQILTIPLIIIARMKKSKSDLI